MARQLTEGGLIGMFGATGDLAKRKLFPALFALYAQGLMGGRFAIVGFARRPLTVEQFRTHVADSIREFGRKAIISDEKINSFIQHISYCSLDSEQLESYLEHKATLESMEKKFQCEGNRLFYLALAPHLFGTVCGNLRESGWLNIDGWKRVIIEKPFGYDRETAVEMNAAVQTVFEEDEVYRIDHYLGKEMVQQIPYLRFANPMFEPFWNRDYVSNVQLTFAETVGVEERGEYYEKSGAMRDMGQNHMLQVLSVVGMERPTGLTANAVRDQKVKVLRSLRINKNVDTVSREVVRGQYSSGESRGHKMPAYRTEKNVDPQSSTESFFAARVFVDTPRWKDVPFFIRTGKRMPRKVTEIVLELKKLPEVWRTAARDEAIPGVAGPLLLRIQIQPEEKISMGIYMRDALQVGAFRESQMVWKAEYPANRELDEAYERLFWDALNGDSMYFARWDEVESAWNWVDPIEKTWQSLGSNGLEFYPAGSWGPSAADALIALDGFEWWTN